MRIPLSWLAEYVAIEESAATLADMLTNAGLEVTEVERIGGADSPLPWEPDLVRLAQLLEVRPHPDADRLVLATVDAGLGAAKTVVTGAPNLRPFLGQGDLARLDLRSPILLEGATYLDPYKEGRATVLKGRALRGVYNDAMLSSPAEIGLADDHEGVLLFPGSELGREVPAGVPLVEVLGDTVIDIDIIPNIARCASILGVAREVAALTGRPLSPPDLKVRMEGGPIEGRVVLHAEEPDLNPRFVLLLVEGVDQRPSPFWMQHRLRLAGQRPIHAVVDVSNYVMLELGQPNHTFDFDVLRRRADRYDVDGPVRIITRLARPGEKLDTLDGESRDLPRDSILVTDPAGCLSLGGIMGGLESEIRPETTNVLVEAASWEYVSIRRTSRQLGLHTEAAFRFGRGVHPSQALDGARRAAELLRRHAGGVVAEGVVDHYPRPAATVTIDLRAADVRRLTGIDLGSDEIRELLERLEFAVERQPDGLRVTVPDHRLDVEGAHDLVEEVCRMFGYDRIPSTRLADTLPSQRGNPHLEAEAAVENALVREGLQQVVTYRLTTPESEARLDVELASRPYVRLVNPSTADRIVMRHSLLASVLEVAAKNGRFADRIQLFEVGDVFPLPADESLPRQEPHLAIVMAGPRAPAHWEGAESPPIDFYDLKGVVEGLLAALGLVADHRPKERAGFRPGRMASILVEGEDVGTFGELHPVVAERFGLARGDDRAVLAADVALAPLLRHRPPVPVVTPVSVYPSVHEDLALVVPRGVAAIEVRSALLEAGRPLLREVELFDRYEGEGIAPGHTSLAYHLTFQAPDRTLTGKDTERARRKILGGLERRLGVVLRE